MLNSIIIELTIEFRMKQFLSNRQIQAILISMQQKIIAIEAQNLAKKYQFVSERINELRKQNAMLHAEISRLKDQNNFLNKINTQMVRKLAVVQDIDVKQNTTSEIKSDKQDTEFKKIISKIHRLSDYELKTELERLLSDQEYFFQDNNLMFSKKDSPLAKVQTNSLEKRFQSTKSMLKNFSNICNRICQSGDSFLSNITEFCEQIDTSTLIFKENKEIQLLIKYSKQLLKEVFSIVKNLTQSLQNTFVQPAIQFYKNELEKYKQVRKKSTKQQEQYDNFLYKLLAIKKNTPLMTYSALLKNYFIQTQSLENTRLTAIQCYNSLSLQINEQVTQLFLNMLIAFKNMFNQSKMLSEEVEDVSVYLTSVKLRKKQIRQLALDKIQLIKTNQLIESVSKQDKIISKQGYLFSKTTKEFKRKYYKIEAGKLCKLKTDKNKSVIIRKEIVSLELTNLKQSSDSENINSFELSSPNMKKSIIFVAQTEYELKEWCTAIKNNIEITISKRVSSSQDLTQAQEKQSKKKYKTSEKISKVNTCADCGQVSPSWISLNLLTIICLECSGYHRKLGNYSKIRSLKLDIHDNRIIETFEKYGNEFVNKIWEGKIIDVKKPGPNSESKDKEVWIRWKYVDKKFMDLEKLPSCAELRQNLEKLDKQSEK